MQHVHLCDRHLQAETAWKGRSASSKLWDTSFICLQVHRSSREWKNTPKGHHSPVQIADYPFHPSWKDSIKGMSVLKASQKTWNCTKGVSGGEKGWEKNAHTGTGTAQNKPLGFWVEFAKQVPGSGLLCLRQLCASTAGGAEPSALWPDLETELKDDSPKWYAHTVFKPWEFPKQGGTNLKSKGIFHIFRYHREGLSGRITVIGAERKSISSGSG